MWNSGRRTWLVVMAALATAGLMTANVAREDALIGYSEVSHVSTPPKGSEVLLDTEKGQIKVLLLRKNAPQTALAVAQLASQSEDCASCRFYRNEARPTAGELGPPYGLLQGSLASINGLPPREGNLITRRGHACMIPGTKEFFIALSDHSEWGTAHTVWGEVEDMEAVDAIVAEPFHEITHPDYGTKMRMLDSEVPFKISIGAA